MQWISDFRTCLKLNSRLCIDGEAKPNAVGRGGTARSCTTTTLGTHMLGQHRTGNGFGSTGSSSAALNGCGSWQSLCVFIRLATWMPSGTSNERTGALVSDVRESPLVAHLRLPVHVHPCAQIDYTHTIHPDPVVQSTEHELVLKLARRRSVLQLGLVE